LVRIFGFTRDLATATHAVLGCTHHHVLHRDSWQLEQLANGTVIARLEPKAMICKPNAP
jgi:hypothetical protein